MSYNYSSSILLFLLPKTVCIKKLVYFHVSYRATFLKLALLHRVKPNMKWKKQDAKLLVCSKYCWFCDFQILCLEFDGFHVIDFSIMYPSIFAQSGRLLDSNLLLKTTLTAQSALCIAITHSAALIESWIQHTLPSSFIVLRPFYRKHGRIPGIVEPHWNQSRVLDWRLSNSCNNWTWGRLHLD